MALLDYLFPPQDNQLGGLLGMDDERLRKQAQQAGLLNMGLGIISASGPSRMPQGLLQPVATGIMAGQQAYQGTMDQQMQQAAARQKLEREANFRKAIGGAFSMSPSAEGIRQTQTNIDPGLLEGMSAQQVIAAAPKTERVLDENKFMSALAEYNPLEFAKMQAQTTKSSEDPLAKFKAFTNLDPAQQAAYKAYVQLTSPQTTITANLAEKGVDTVIKDRIGEFSSAAAAARRFATDAASINTILKGKGGGEIVKIGTALAKDLGLKSDQVTAQDLANSIAIRGATTMRAPGSGATSDLEFRAYQAAFPSLSNSETGRAFMAAASTKFAQRSAKLSDYAMKLYRENKYSEEAIAAYDQSLGSVIDLKEMETLTKSAPATQRKDFRQKDQ